MSALVPSAALFGPVAYFFFLLAVIGSVGAYVAVERLLRSSPDTGTDLTKLAKKELGLATAFSSLNPKGGFLDRLDLFLIRALRLDTRLEEIHTMLGRPLNPTPLQMLHMKELMAVLAMIMIFLLTDSPALSLFGLTAFFLPDMIFNRQIRSRQTEIMRQFPTMVDLAALTIEAGLDYMSAFDRIIKSSRIKGELENEMEKTLGEISLGYTRRDALRRFAMRTGLQEIRSFVGLIIQSDELGTSLVDLLRNYASDMRFRRLNKAEKLAAQASTKMLFPLFIFIFPTVFIMMLAPMMKSLMTGGLGF
ncbi:MAG: type II secretion system F family protein [Elusimicrobia bacterium]|nr:type II secretion system F family protein [Elusimicrobiota bacterium]